MEKLLIQKNCFESRKWQNSFFSKARILIPENCFWKQFFKQFFIKIKPRSDSWKIVFRTNYFVCLWQARFSGNPRQISGNFGRNLRFFENFLIKGKCLIPTIVFWKNCIFLKARDLISQKLFWKQFAKTFFFKMAGHFW